MARPGETRHYRCWMSELVVEAPIVRGNRHEVNVDDRLLWFEFDGPPPSEPQAGAAAVALLPWAMAHGQALRIDAAVDRDLVAHLEEFRDYWATVLPSVFQAIEIRPTELVDAAPGPRRAVAAFSGGVDATYQLIANCDGRLGARSLPIEAAVMIHGFDIPHLDDVGIRRATKRATALLDSFGVRLSVVRTNWLAEFCPEWEMTHAAGIAAVLHHYSGMAGWGLIAADEPYDLAIIPWGSNSTSNPMLGGTAFRIRSDGAAAGRTEKCRLIGQSPAALENLRVCWAGDVKGSNCGSCEKCVRTKLNFLAAGVPVVPALGGAVTPSEIDGVRASNAIQIAHLREILRYDLPSEIEHATRAAVIRNERLNEPEPVRTVYSRFRRTGAVLKHALRR
jgi:hypothetical protein